MSKTMVADVIVPTTFERYAIERTAELSRFVRCGIIEAAPELDRLAAAGGREVKMPFWKDLSGARQILSDSTPLSVNKISSEQSGEGGHNGIRLGMVRPVAWRGARGNDSK